MPGDIEGAAVSYSLSDSSLTLNLNSDVASLLTDVVAEGSYKAQFRVMLSPDSYSNFNGACTTACMLRMCTCTCVRESERARQKEERGMQLEEEFVRGWE
jgi:hypothetical protein